MYIIIISSIIKTDQCEESNVMMNVVFQNEVKTSTRSVRETLH